MTQVLGGYVSDRVGGERVMLVAAVLWSSIMLCTPWLIQISTYSSHSLYIVVLFRILLGASQGTMFIFLLFIIPKLFCSLLSSLFRLFCCLCVCVCFELLQ